MDRPFGFIEDLDSARRITLGRLLGVRVALTPLAWLSSVLLLWQGVAFTLTRPDLTGRQRLAAGARFALAAQMTNLVHAFGHVVGGRLVGAPMEEMLLTGTRIANRYVGDHERLPSQVHLGRALGGPTANLSLAVLAAGLLVLPARAGRPFLRWLLLLNLLAGLGALLPIPSVDGEVIWRELRGRRSRRASAVIQTHAPSPYAVRRQ
jgi:hypothetical protein